MSSIHYKFRASLDTKTLQFDGLWILCSELKRLIFAQENIRSEAFDLVIQNSQTKRTYGLEDQVPRNCSIIIQRVPREDAEKLPKIQGVNTGAVASNAPVESSGAAHLVSTTDFEKMSEEERLEVIKHESTAAYHSTNFQKRPTGPLTGPPPPTYTCNRCYQPGHWFKNCPMLNTRRTTGIPMEELMETTPDDPRAMLHPTGKYVIPKMHYIARQQQAMRKGTDEVPILERIPPPEFTCPICKHLLKEAVMTTCCGNTFCAECINQSLLDSEDRHCPGSGCSKTQVSIDSLVPNKNVRTAVNKWQTSGDGAEVTKIRIGLQPTSTAPPTITVPTTAPFILPTVHISVPSTGASSSPAHQPASQEVPPGIEAPPGVSPEQETTVAPAPAPVAPIPTAFTQPPPAIPGSSLSHPMMAQMSNLPPGISMPVQPGLTYLSSVYTGMPAVDPNMQYYAWEAYVNRKPRHPRGDTYRSSNRDRDVRDHRRRREYERSRSPDNRRSDRSSRSDRKVHSKEDRRKEEVRDKHRSSRRRSRSYEDKKLGDDERTRKRDSKTSSDRHERKRRERRPSSLENEEKKKRRTPVEAEGDMDEAAIDDALKEAEELEAMKSDGGEAIEVDACGSGDTSQQISPVSVPEPSIKSQSAPEIETAEDQQMASSSAPSPASQASTVEKTSPTQDEEERGPQLEKPTIVTTMIETPESQDEGEHRKEEAEKDESETESEHRARKHKKAKKHKRERDDGERKKDKKHKKRKKEKKEKKNKRDRDEESDDDRKARKKEKRERKDSDREHRKSSRHKDETRDRSKDRRHSDSKTERKESARDSDRRQDESKERERVEKKEKDRVKDRKDGEPRVEKTSKTRERSPAATSKATLEDGSSSEDKKKALMSRLDRKQDKERKVVIDEDNLKAHFEPTAQMLRKTKITMNI